VSLVEDSTFLASDRLQRARELRWILGIAIVGAPLLTPFGRRDAPSPASGRLPAIPGLVHKSLPPAGSRARPSAIPTATAFGDSTSRWQALKDLPTNKISYFA